jgi:hypothetical protein
MVFRNGGSFEGEWEDDNWGDLTGTLVTKTGETFSGKWHGQALHGRGSVRYSDGITYNGEFHFGKRHGHGNMIYANGDDYTGEWANDKREGRGTMTQQKGGRYEGQWARDMRNGEGKFTSDDNDVCLHARWNDDVVCDGHMREENHASGSVYDGNMIKGKKAGLGKMEFGDGSTYRGQWQDNFPFGEGTQEDPSTLEDGGTYVENGDLAAAAAAAAAAVYDCWACFL